MEEIQYMNIYLDGQACCLLPGLLYAIQVKGIGVSLSCLQKHGKEEEVTLFVGYI